jgi:hypothetical protein
MRHFVFSLLLALLFAVPAHGQSAVATEEAPVYLQPGHVTPLRTAAPGTVFKVLSERGDWVQVEFNDPQFGRRVGWVMKKLVRLERPELKPMDLSVKEAQPGETRQAPVDPSRDEFAMATSRTHAREGFMFNAGLGYGTLGCEECVDRWNGVSGGLMFGWQVHPKVTVGFGTSGFAGDVEGFGVATGTLDARFRFYFKNDGPAAGLHVNLGAGLGHLTFEDEDTEWGAGFMLGVGWDIRAGRRISITPFWNGFAMANDLVDANVGQIGIGITIH